MHAEIVSIGTEIPTLPLSPLTPGISSVDVLFGIDQPDFQPRERLRYPFPGLKMLLGPGWEAHPGAL
jgi:hypothetical protein